jgi:cell wall-associated NlpC family hydrolase
VVTVASIAALATVPGSASASPKPTIAQVQRRVAALNRQAEQATERFDQARIALADAQRQLTAVQNKFDRQRAALAAEERLVGQMATAAYKSGGVSPSLQLILSRNPDSFLEQASALRQLNRKQADTLRRMLTARQRLASDRAAVTQQHARAAAIKSQIAGQRKTIEDKLAQAKDLLGSLKAAERRRLEALQRAQVLRASRSATRTLPTPTYSGPASGAAATAVRTAYGQLGDPYVYGAAGPDAFDCSGLTMYSWGAAGVGLPHSSSAQYSATRHVSLSELQPGDLVFYYSPISHVAIYVGNGQIIHAPHPGESVQLASLYSMPVTGAGRP